MRVNKFAAHKPNFAIKSLGKQILNNKLFYGAVKSFRSDFRVACKCDFNSISEWRGYYSKTFSQSRDFMPRKVNQTMSMSKSNWELNWSGIKKRLSGFVGPTENMTGHKAH